MSKMSEAEAARRTRAVLKQHEQVVKRRQRCVHDDEEAFRRIQRSSEYESLRNQLAAKIWGGS